MFKELKDDLLGSTLSCSDRVDEEFARIQKNDPPTNILSDIHDSLAEVARNGCMNHTYIVNFYGKQNTDSISLRLNRKWEWKGREYADIHLIFNLSDGNRNPGDWQMRRWPSAYVWETVPKEGGEKDSDLPGAALPVYGSNH